MQLDSVIYFDQVVGMPVEVFFAPVLDTEDSHGIHDARLYYQDADCEAGTPLHFAFVRADRASDAIGILDQNTGLVWVRNEISAPSNRNLDSIRHLGVVGAGTPRTAAGPLRFMGCEAP